jgi:hypothetical protein
VRSNEFLCTALAGVFFIILYFLKSGINFIVVKHIACEHGN